VQSWQCGAARPGVRTHRRFALVVAVAVAASTLVVGAATPASAATVRRLSGPNRYATAAVISASTFSAASTVYTATGENFPDALAGGPAAAREKAPILLLQRNAVPQETLNELGRLRPTKIVVLGGSAAVTDAVVAQLATKATGGAERRAAGDRYGTAATISAATFPAGVPVAYVATGAGFPDALAGGAAAAARGGPVLLTAPNTLPGVTADELRRLRPASITILGGTTSVSAEVEAQLRAFSSSVQRLAGSDRYATAARVSAATFAPARPDVFLATGANFPDALAGGPAAGVGGGPLLLVQRTCIPPVVRAEIDRLAPNRITILGGTGAVGASVESLRTCTTPPGNPSSFAFLLKKADGSPYRFNTCAPIGYVVNLGGAYPSAMEDLKGAFERIGEALGGVDFVHEGPTDELPRQRRPAYQPERYGRRWAPLLVAWVRPDQTDVPLEGLDGNGSLTVINGVAVTGQVTLNVAAPLVPGYSVNVSWGGTLLHEVGHAMNLAHVNDPDQIMKTPAHERRYAELGAGDVGGLRLLGRDQGCLTPPALP
jgi:putative cell wall-binding protein